MALTVIEGFQLVPKLTGVGAKAADSVAQVKAMPGPVTALAVGKAFGIADGSTIAAALDFIDELIKAIKT